MSQQVPNAVGGQQVPYAVGHAVGIFGEQQGQDVAMQLEQSAADRKLVIGAPECETKKDRLANVSPDVLDYLSTSFLTAKEQGQLAALSRTHYHSRQGAAARVIFLLLDNTMSMLNNKLNAKTPKMDLMRQFVESFLRPLRPTARICVFLIDESVGQSWSDLAGDRDHRRAMNKVEVLHALEVAAWSNPKLFCRGRTTPLLSSFCALVNQHFRQGVVVTDGEEKVVRTQADFDALPLMDTTMGTIRNRYNESSKKKLKFDKKRPLVSLHNMIRLVIHDNKALLAAIVGLQNDELANMTSDLSSLATLQLNDSKDVNDAAQRVRRSTIPRESGGGDDTKSHAALVGSRRDAAHSGKGLHQLAFCSPHNHYVRQLMLGHRYTQLKNGAIVPPSTWKVVSLGTEEEKKRWCTSTASVKSDAGDGKDQKDAKATSLRSGVFGWMRANMERAAEELEASHAIVSEQFGLDLAAGHSERILREAGEYYFARISNKKRTKLKLKVEEVVLALSPPSPADADYAKQQEAFVRTWKRLKSAGIGKMSVSAFYWVRQSASTSSPTSTRHEKALSPSPPAPSLSTKDGDGDVDMASSSSPSSSSSSSSSSSNSASLGKRKLDTDESEDNDRESKRRPTAYGTRDRPTQWPGHSRPGYAVS